MSQFLQEVLNRLGTEPKFRESMKKDPKAALTKYATLDDAEKQALSAMAMGFSSDLATGRKVQWIKDWGPMILSALLLVVFIYVLHSTLLQITIPPEGVPVGENTQVFDRYERAKDLLDSLFPLFSAVVTFWLGVTVESKRADQNQDTAEESQERENETIEATALAIGEIKGRVENLFPAAQATASLNQGQLDELKTFLSKTEGKWASRRRRI